MNDIAIRDRIVFAFQPPATGILGTLFAPMLHVVLEANHLRANKALLKIGMNNRGGLWRSGARADSPGANFIGSCGEVGLQVE